MRTSNTTKILKKVHDAVRASQMPLDEDDGMPNHPKAKKNCQYCGGHGLLDDGDFACILVPCVCTGEASDDVKAKLKDQKVP